MISRAAYGTGIGHVRCSIRYWHRARGDAAYGTETGHVRCSIRYWHRARGDAAYGTEIGHVAQQHVCVGPSGGGAEGQQQVHGPAHQARLPRVLVYPKPHTLAVLVYPESKCSLPETTHARSTSLPRNNTRAVLV
eukprot:3342945-Rhodomonas_salina.1